MSIYWPSTLQSVVNEQGFTMKFGDTTIRSSNDTGPQKVRRRSTRPIDFITCSVNLTTEEFATFYTFFNTTTNGGVTPFLFNHPITGVESSFRFMGPPEITPVGGRYFSVSMSWEIMP